MIKVSVVIPTYKPSNYIERCIESLAMQTLPKEDFEIIIVLNGIKEPYYEYILSKIQLYPDSNFRLIYSEKSGVSIARNTGLDIARGDYIAFIDDDDYVSPVYLEELYSKADEKTIPLSYAYAFNDGEDRLQLPYSITREYDRCSPRGKQKAILPKKYFSGPCMKLINRNIIGERRFIEGIHNGEDSLFMFQISDKVKYADFTSKKAIYYRRFRVNSATTSLKSLSYILSNCGRRFVINSIIYFSGMRNYSFLRYFITILGLGHIIVDELYKKILRLF